MDEMIWLRLLGGGLGGGFDLAAMLAFIAIAFIYLLVPVLGHYQARPERMLTALYLLIAYGGVALLQLLVTWAQLVDPSLPGPFAGREAAVHLSLAFTGLKTAVFLAALVVFVLSLRSVRLRVPGGGYPGPGPYQGPRTGEER